MTASPNILDKFLELQKQHASVSRYEILLNDDMPKDPEQCSFILPAVTNGPWGEIRHSYLTHTDMILLMRSDVYQEFSSDIHELRIPVFRSGGERVLPEPPVDKVLLSVGGWEGKFRWQSIRASL